MGAVHVCFQHSDCQRFDCSNGIYHEVDAVARGSRGVLVEYKKRIHLLCAMVHKDYFIRFSV